MPFSDLSERVCIFCRHSADIGRFQEFVINDCDDFIHVFVRGGSKRDWKIAFSDCEVREMLFDEFMDIIKVMTKMIGDPLYYKKE